MNLLKSLLAFLFVFVSTLFTASDAQAFALGNHVGGFFLGTLDCAESETSGTRDLCRENGWLNYDTLSGCAVATNRTTRTNFNQYEAIFESPISGTSRSAHRNSANSFFANQLENSTDLQRAVNNEFGTDVLQHMNSGSGRNLLNPPGTQWHHPIDNPNVMQLLRTGEHTNPMLQPVLHPGPNGTGGFGTFF